MRAYSRMVPMAGSPTVIVIQSPNGACSAQWMEKPKNVIYATLLISDASLPWNLSHHFGV